MHIYTYFYIHTETDVAKTNILTNLTCGASALSLSIHDMNTRILPHDGQMKYLGQVTTLYEPLHTRYLLKLGLRLFDQTVTPSIPSRQFNCHRRGRCRQKS